MNKPDFKKRQKAMEECEKILGENGILIRHFYDDTHYGFVIKGIDDEFMFTFYSADVTDYGIEFTKKIKELEKEIAKKQDEIDKLLKDNYNYQSEIDDCRFDLECCKNKNIHLREQKDDLEKRMKLFSMLNNIEKSGLYEDSVEAYINSKISIKDAEIEVLREKISELESELSVKENLLKIKNKKRGDKTRMHLIKLRELGGEQYMRYSDVEDLIKELEN